MAAGRAALGAAEEEIDIASSVSVPALILHLGKAKIKM